MTQKEQERHQRLDWIKTTLASVPEGAAALELARITNAEIYFDDALPCSDGKKRGISGQFVASNINNPFIRLNPAFPNKQLVETLAHELRHLWQYTKVNFIEEEKLRPIDRLAFMRLLEGDANAFAALVTAKIRRVTRLDITCKLHATISWIDKLRGRHRNPDFIMPRVFSGFQAREFNGAEASAYETGLLKQMKQIQAENNPYKMHKSLSETFNNVSEILAIAGTKNGQNYLAAKDVDDYVRKIETALRDEIRAEAQSYTPPARKSIFGP